MNKIDFCSGLLLSWNIHSSRRGECHYQVDKTFKTSVQKIKKSHECIQNIWNYKIVMINSPFLFSYFALVTGTMETFACVILVHVILGWP